MSAPTVLRRLFEALDSPYRWRSKFETEEVEDEEYDDGSLKTVLSPVQFATFTGEDGTNYRWYARQSRHSPDVWEIAFGVDKGEVGGAHQLGLELTGSRDPFRVFATVLEITNAFIEFDESETGGYEVRFISFTAKGENRGRLYLNRLIPKIEHFELERYELGPEATFLLARTSL